MVISVPGLNVKTMTCKAVYANQKSKVKKGGSKKAALATRRVYPIYPNDSYGTQ